MFSWQAADTHDRRLRVVAAFVLLAAGWATGFFAGRMSAWVFPVAETETAALATASPAGPATALAKPQPSPPEAATNEPTEAAPRLPAQPSSSATSDRSAKSEANSSSSPASDIAKEDAEVASAPADVEDRTPPAAADEKTSKGATVLVNPNWDQVKPSPPPGPARAERNRADGPRDDVDELSRRDEADILECERRYASFRRSDGTYQPYDSRSRRLCPFLR